MIIRNRETTLLLDNNRVDIISPDDDSVLYSLELRKNGDLIVIAPEVTKMNEKVLYDGFHIIPSSQKEITISRPEFKE